MSLLSKRWFAWTLRLATDVTLVLWLLLLGWVLVLRARENARAGPSSRQGSVYSEIHLPAEIVEVSDPRVSVFNFEASQLRIHYRTTHNTGALQGVMALAGIVVWWGLFALVLWQLRQILTTFVHRAPLTLENARRFRIISYLLATEVAVTSLARSLEYVRLEPLFPMLPPRGFVGLYLGHIEWSRLFMAMLILLLSEAMRLGAEHRLDSEAVV